MEEQPLEPGARCRAVLRSLGDKVPPNRDERSREGLEQFAERQPRIGLSRHERTLDRCQRETSQVIGLPRVGVDAERNVDLLSKPSERQLAHALDHDVDLRVAIHPRLGRHDEDQAQELGASLESLDDQPQQTA